jgi:pimeloyl-ACP methyl ester carboxylesterase
MSPTARRIVALAIAGALGLGACGERIIVGSSDDTAPDGARASDATTTTAPPASVEVGEIAWRACPGSQTLECGRLEVPFDYADPDVGSFDLRLVRRPASDPQARIGSMLVNPGGPGFGGTSVARDAQWYFSADLLTAFDVVGWDPRGTGESTPAIDCVDTYDEYFGLDSPPGTPEEKQALVDAAEAFNAACEERSGEILPYVSTRASAQDVDSIRRALGEDTITYFGFSYGSELGATWVTMFPDTVRAAVLDGASDPNASSLEAGLAQARGFERQLDAFLADCSARPTCAFHSGGDAEGALDALIAEIDAEPVPTYGMRIPVTQGVLFTAIAQAMYSDTLWPRLAVGLADAVEGDGSGLLELYDEYYQRQPDGSYGNELEAFIAISCLDDPGAVGVAAADAVIPQFERAAKRFGPNFGHGYSCALWPVPQAPRVTITGIGAGPVVVVGTTGDAATPLSSSRKAAAALEEGVLVVVEADRHTGYGVNQCVVDLVDAYLMDLKVPKPETVCR